MQGLRKTHTRSRDCSMTTGIKILIATLIGICAGITIGFTVYHVFFLDKMSCCYG